MQVSNKFGKVTYPYRSTGGELIGADYSRKPMMQFSPATLWHLDSSKFSKPGKEDEIFFFTESSIAFGLILRRRFKLDKDDIVPEMIIFSMIIFYAKGTSVINRLPSRSNVGAKWKKLPSLHL